MSVEDRSDASLVGLTTLAFFFDPLGIGGEWRAMASIAIKEATGWFVGGGVGGVLFLIRFDTVATTFGPLSDLFMVEEALCVLTIFLVEERTEGKKKKNNTKTKKKRDGRNNKGKVC